MKIFDTKIILMIKFVFLSAIYNNINNCSENKYLNAKNPVQDLQTEKLLIEQKINTVETEFLYANKNFNICEKYINILHNLNDYNFSYLNINIGQKLMLNYIEKTFNINLYCYDNIAIVLEINKIKIFSFEYKGWMVNYNQKTVFLGMINFHTMYNFFIQNTKSSHKLIKYDLYIEIIRFYCDKKNKEIISTCFSDKKIEYVFFTCTISNNIDFFSYNIILYDLFTDNIIIKTDFTHHTIYFLPILVTRDVVKKFYYIAKNLQYNNFTGIINFNIYKNNRFFAIYDVKKNSIIGNYIFSLLKRFIKFTIYKDIKNINDYVEIQLTYYEDTIEKEGYLLLIQQKSFSFIFKKIYTAKIILSKYDPIALTTNISIKERFKFYLPEFKFVNYNNFLINNIALDNNNSCYLFNYFTCIEINVNLNGDFTAEFYNKFNDSHNHKTSSLKLHYFIIGSLLNIFKLFNEFFTVIIYNKYNYFVLDIVYYIFSFKNLQNFAFFGYFNNGYFDILNYLINTTYNFNIFIDGVDNFYIFNESFYTIKIQQYKNILYLKKKVICYNEILIFQKIC